MIGCPESTHIHIAKTARHCLPSPRSLTVRILGFHPRDLGSIPSEEVKAFLEPIFGSKEFIENLEV